MGQSAPRTLLLLLAGLLGEALAGFPNTISIGKRPPRHRDPRLPRQPGGSCVEGSGGRARAPRGKSQPCSASFPLLGARGSGGARAAPAGGCERRLAARTPASGGDRVRALRNSALEQCIPWST